VWDCRRRVCLGIYVARLHDTCRVFKTGNFFFFKKKKLSWLNASDMLILLKIHVKIACDDTVTTHQSLEEECR
jgi:hypothetical protein